LLAGGIVLLAVACQPVQRDYQPAMPVADEPVPPKLAYVQDGDIVVCGLPECAPLRLTTDGENRAPRWSVSGEWLAFLKGDESPALWVVRRSGEDAQRIDDAQPGAGFAWSPAGDQLAYASPAGVVIWEAGAAAPARTWAPTPVTALPGGGHTGPGGLAWSPNGEWVAFVWSTWDEAAETTRDGLWKAPAAGGAPIELYAGGPAGAGQPILAGWSGDGQFILFWQGAIRSASLLADGVPLYTLPAAGGEPHLLADPVLVHSDAVASHPQSGPQVAVVVGGYRATWTTKQLQVISTAGETAAVQPLTAAEQAASSPAWSPDGERLAFATMPDQGELGGGEAAQAGLMQRRIWIWGGDTQPARQLTDDPAYRDERPRWVDADTLLFARLDDAGRASLWQIDIEGSAPERIVEELTPAPDWFGYYGHIAWDDLWALWTPVPAIP
jgi:Tol biopolymer transport system component